jgi:hypothetical protein
MEIFDEQTNKKSPGKYRLLVVDGHNSHYTIEFLLHARLNMIIVLCYPAHGTHVYQGLDVVIFSVLKRFLAEARDTLLRDTGASLDKTNFLEIYASAHTRALTKENILRAFAKTGVWPFCRDVVTDDMLAPSKETSCESHLPVPPAPTGAIKILTDMFCKLSLVEDDETEPSNRPELIPSNASSTSKASKLDVILEAVDSLSQTDIAHIFNTTLTSSSDPMSHTKTQTIPSQFTPTPLLSIDPQTDNEILLLAALREAEARNQILLNRTIELQASNILNEAYCGKLKRHLAHQENKKKDKGKGTLVGDGLPRVLTGDAFYEAVVEFRKAKDAEERDAETRKDAKVVYAAALKEWMEGEAARKAEKEELMIEYRHTVACWEKVKARSARNRTKFDLPKPKMPKFDKAALRPRMKDFIAGGSGKENENENESSDSDSEHE